MTDPILHYYHLERRVTAFSTTRQGGYGQGHYGTFNINPFCGDDEEAVKRNREALCRLLDIGDDHLLMPHQVHQAEIAVVDSELMGLSADQRQQRLEGVDALMTNLTGICIGVSTADCIPILLYDQGHHAVCAIHAGWRGTVQRIVEKAVTQMTAVYGTRPSDLTAQIGPGISLECFEVGDEVYEAFAREGFPMELISIKYRANTEKPLVSCCGPSSASGKPSGHKIQSQERWHIDLPACNRLQLMAAGVCAASIAPSPACTFQQSATFFSARRLGINSGRIFNGILLR